MFIESTSFVSHLMFLTTMEILKYTSRGHDLRDWFQFVLSISFVIWSVSAYENKNIMEFQISFVLEKTQEFVKYQLSETLIISWFFIIKCRSHHRFSHYTDISIVILAHSLVVWILTNYSIVNIIYRLCSGQVTDKPPSLYKFVSCKLSMGITIFFPFSNECNDIIIEAL